MTDRLSSFERLRALPPVFDTRDVIRLLGEGKSAIYCSRWKKAGLVSPLGQKTVGVFFNLIADPNGPVTRRAEAVAKLLRRPFLVVGPAALHAHGWTTQRHHVLHLATPVTSTVRSLPTLDHGIRLLPRSLRWFGKLVNGSEGGIEDFKVANPSFALADALLASPNRMDWKPEADEIEIPDDESYTAVSAALAALGAKPDQAAALLDSFQPDRSETAYFL